VLVVEDEPRMAGLLKRALQEEGHAVDVAVPVRKNVARVVRRQRAEDAPDRHGRDAAGARIRAWYDWRNPLTG
jgi:DNA-binding response OmpR family regulator